LGREYLILEPAVRSGRQPPWIDWLLMNSRTGFRTQLWLI
jgi:hypothetical protein